MNDEIVQQQTTTKVKAARSPKQVLQQDICQKYGWSCTITTTSNIPAQKQESNGNVDQGMIGALRSIELNQIPIKIDRTNEANSVHVESLSCQIQQPLQYLCTVIVGYQKEFRFISTESEIDVCQQTIHGLQSIIQEEEQKPILSLQEFLSTPQILNGNTIPIYDSSDVRNWDYFWSHKPTVVGMDTEGNNSIPPILIQIAVMDNNNNNNNNTTNEMYCIIEAPATRRRPSPRHSQKNNLSNCTTTDNSNAFTPNVTISVNLQRLLNDTSIVKVFCDNFAHKDKVALGIHASLSSLSSTDCPNNAQKNGQDSLLYGFQNTSTSSIIDLECIMNEMYGPVKVARGLSRIVSMTIAPNMQIGKSSGSSSTNPNTNVTTTTTSTNQTASAGRWKNIKKFALIEQGKIKPITNIFRDLSSIELQYAAGDACATLLVYNYLLYSKR